ncbi:MAG: CapA family protein [Fibromonadales bacterium]|nr:CapA family protein [Fibromonadales bacterium]
MKKVLSFFLLASTVFAAKDTLSFVAVGDIMMGMNYPENGQYLPPQDGKLTFAEVQDILRNADITVGNLEGVMLDSGGNAKQCINHDICYTFRMPEKYVNLLVDAGFDLMSIANNHSGDFGEAGRKSTLRVLKEAGLGYAGFEETAETYVLEKEGVRYGFVAFAPNSGTVRFHDTEKAKRLISGVKAKSDIVIVSMHIGAEGSNHARVTRKTETFLGDNRGNPYEFARIAIDAGADMVFGHGPHVPRAIDIYKGKFIAYSLGNFATNASVNISGISGYAPIVKIKTDSKGNFIEGEIFSAIQQGEKGSRRPFLDSTGACIKKMKELTETDIPEAGLLIDTNGKIRLKK